MQIKTGASDAKRDGCAVLVRTGHGANWNNMCH